MEQNFIRRVTIDWDKVEETSYLRSIPALFQLQSFELNRPVTLFAGENGTGKSTLLEAIAVAYGFNPEGGTLNYRFSTYDDVSPLSDVLQLSKGYRKAKWGYFFRAESFFNLASKAEDDRKSDIWVKPKEIYYERNGGRALHEQSHGESFLSFFQGNDQPGLYLMDEPEASLSAQRQLALLAQIVRMARAGSQFLIASHSPILLGIPDSEILSFDEGTIHPCDFEQTGSFQIFRLFLNQKEKVLHQLLEEQDETT